MAGGADVAGRSVTSRALEVLGAFDTDHRRLTLSEVAARAGIPLTTTHRLVKELVTWGALARRDDGTYVVGSRLWDLGLLAPVHVELRQVASPFLQDVYAATRDTVHLAVRDGDQTLYVDRLSGQTSVPVVSTVGSRLPLHTTGVGKVLLAYAPEGVVRGVMANLTRPTRHSITQPGRLARELSEVRRRGYARTAEEMSLGTVSVAVPIRDLDDRVVAAVGIVAPSSRRDITRLVPALLVAANGIARHLLPEGSYAPSGSRHTDDHHDLRVRHDDGDSVPAAPGADRPPMSFARWTGPTNDTTNERRNTCSGTPRPSVASPSTTSPRPGASTARRSGSRSPRSAAC